MITPFTARGAASAQPWAAGIGEVRDPCEVWVGETPK
jgi:hypothetical protein